jgi:uncharacterized protein with ATP-grasp and redox domains
MRFSADCVPCLLGRVIFETDLVAPIKREESVNGSMDLIVNGFRGGSNSAKLASRVHERVYSIIDSKDPYLDLKRRSNQAAERILPKARRFVESKEDALKAACLVSIAGNVLDFGIEVGIDDPEQFERKFDQIMQQGIELDNVDRLRTLLEGSERVAFLTDNAGEIVLDRILVEQIQYMGVHVHGIVKGAPILTDATADDLRDTGMDRVFDSWSTTGQFAVGIDLERIPYELGEELKRADLVIAKGMANFESLSDERLSPVVYCAPSVAQWPRPSGRRRIGTSSRWWSDQNGREGQTGGHHGRGRGD